MSVVITTLRKEKNIWSIVCEAASPLPQRAKQLCPVGAF